MDILLRVTIYNIPKFFFLIFFTDNGYLYTYQKHTMILTNIYIS